MRARLGFSLLEVLIALTIFLFTLVGIVSFMVTISKSSGQVLDRDKAIYKANKLTNYLLSLPYDDPCLSIGEHLCSTDSSKCCDGLAGDSNLFYDVELVEANGESVKKLTVHSKYKLSKKEITLEVYKGDWQ